MIPSIPCYILICLICLMMRTSYLVLLGDCDILSFLCRIINVNVMRCMNVCVYVKPEPRLCLDSLPDHGVVGLALDHPWALVRDPRLWAVGLHMAGVVLYCRQLVSVCNS